MRLRSHAAREWAVAVGGGLALAAGLVWLLRAEAIPSAGVEANAVPVSVPAAAPAVPVTPPPPAVAPPPDLMLHGIIQRAGGAAAVVAVGGRQHLIRVGDALASGLRVTRIGATDIALAGPQGEIAVAFRDAAKPAPAAPVTAGGTAGWRLALQAVREGGRIRGWRLTDPAALPQLAAAGLRTGDILTDVAGAPLFSEEKLLDLPGDLAANPTAAIGYLRQGQRRTATLAAP